MGIGFLVGAIANAFGVGLWWVIFSRLDFEVFLKEAYQNEHLGSIISIGALLSLASFFILLRRGLDYRARGVVFYMIVIAFVVLYFNFFSK